MKHIALPLFAVSLILLCACTDDPVLVQRLYLSESALELPKGDVRQLSADIYPDDADCPSVDWTSGDTAVATVSSDGLVTALQVGQTTITAMAADGSGAAAQCSVEVYQCVESVCFSNAEYMVEVGRSATLQASVLPDDAKYKELAWWSDDEAIAVVDSCGTVSGLAVGTCHIVASASNGVNAACTLKVIDEVEVLAIFNGHAYVDLGLPSGTLWATMNVGAASPEGYGRYFAWGETKGYGQEDTSNATNYSYNGSSSYVKAYYDWRTYKWCDGSSTGLTKYCTDSLYGTVDGKTELALADDAARVNWGGAWRLPTLAQLQELLNSCTQKWTTQNRVKGVLVTGPNGNQLFLPAAGLRWYDFFGSDGKAGSYWSSTLCADNDGRAYNLTFSPLRWNWNDSDRYYAHSVRAVCCP